MKSIRGGEKRLKLWLVRALIGSLALSALAQTVGKVRVRPNVQVASGVQIRFVPETLNVAAGGDNDQRGTDESEGVDATTAQLGTPFGIAVDSKGNIYITDTSTALVRRINAADGTITTVAGSNGSSGGGSGVDAVRATASVRVRAQAVMPGTGFALNKPTAIAIGPGDTVYFTDSNDSLIYKLDTSENISVVAGTVGSSGYSPDGTVATQAMLSSPNGVAVDSNGNVYFSDSSNDLVRRIDATSGQITTVAGNYTLGRGYGGDGLPATNAQLANPQGLAFDPTGNLLIADTNNFVIRKLDLAKNTITTVAGNNSYGYSGDGGSATSASLSNPAAIATDAAGDLYISDGSNGVVRRVAPDGTIATVAGVYSTFGLSVYGYGKPATNTRIGRLAGIAIDSAGSILVDGTRNGLVYKIGPSALLDFNQQPLHSQAFLPLTVENTGTSALTFTGNVFKAIGSGFSASPATTNGCVASTTLTPGASCGIVVEFVPQETGDYTGSLNVTDSLGTQIIDLRGTGVRPTPDVSLSVSPNTVTAGDSVTLSSTVSYSNGAVPTGTVSFADDSTGNPLATARLDTNGNASVTTPIPPGVYDVVANYSGDSSYNANSSDDQALTVIAKPAAATLTASATTANSGDSILLNATVAGSSGIPTGNVQFSIDGAGVSTVALSGGRASATVPAPLPGQHTLQAVYLGDSLYGTAFSNVLPLTTHGAVLQFSPGSAITIAGVPSDALHYGFSGDGGPATAARFHTPNGVAVDGAGNVYIADEQNNVIRKVSTNGTITTVVGIPYAGTINSTRFGGDGGLATNAYLCNPSSIALDPAGNLYIADFSNHAIRKVDASDGIIHTIAGIGGVGGFNNAEGDATSIRLNNPIQVALDTAGNLYIVEYGNALVRKVDTSGHLTTIAGNYDFSVNTSQVDGTPANAVAFSHPRGVAVDASGTVYISDSDHNLIRKLVSGKIYTLAGTTTGTQEVDGVLGTSSTLSNPEQLTFDASGNLYIAESRSNVVRKVDKSGIITTVVGYLGAFSSSFYYFDPAGQPADSFQMVEPSGVALDTAGNIYVTDNANQTVIRVGPAGTLLFSPTSGPNDPQTLTLTNVGDAALTFNATPYSITGNYTVASEGAGACSFSAPLAIGASCTVTVRNTAAAGSTGTITFTTNALGSPTVNLKTLSTAVPISTLLQLSENSGHVGDNVLLFAQISVTGAPAAGSIAFFDGTTLLGTSTIGSGYAYMYISTLSAGSHSITAKYLGGGVYGASTSDPQEIDLTGTATLTSLTADKNSASYGTSITFTANVSTSGSVAVTSGSVTFSDGGSVLGTRSVDSNGNATFTTSSLSPGNHSITATYAANGSLQASTSSAFPVNVTGGSGGGGGLSFDYAITVDGVPVVIHRGETKTVNVSVTVLNNFQGVVQLSCGTLPSYATCSFSPQNIIAGGPFPSASSVLTISTTPASGSSQSSPMALRVGSVNGQLQLVAAKP